jgi:hypothetical protein
LKKHYYILTIVLVLTACTQSTSTTSDTLTIKPTTGNIHVEKAPTHQSHIKRRLSYKTVSEITADNTNSTWFQRQVNTTSLTLHFMNKGMLNVSYSPECWLNYPYKLDGNKIVVFWDTIIDTKYRFDIVKTINKIDKKFVGKPFMILELENDTTFKATYPIKSLIETINQSNKERLFFPDRYVLSHNGYF